MFKNVDNVARI